MAPEVEVTNLADAIAGGMLRASPALADRLARAERELAEIETVAQPASVGPVRIAVLLPRVLDKFRDLALNLERLAGHDVVRARTELARLVGPVTMHRDEAVLVAEINRAHVAGALLTAAGSTRQMVMVAGAGFSISERVLDVTPRKRRWA